MTGTRIIQVKLTPKASSARVGDICRGADGRDILPVYVTAVPEGGKANEAMIRLLAKHFGVAVSRVRLVRGHTSRQKTIEITDEWDRD